MAQPAFVALPVALRLQLRQHLPDSHFAIEPTGQFMLVANQSGGNVIVFRINPDNGALTPTGASGQVPSPVCVRFTEMK